MNGFNGNLVSYCEERIGEFHLIEEARKSVLMSLSGYISSKLKNRFVVNLTFICTHNSRRSQFGQIWAQTAALWYGVENIHTFSGGTESAAFNQKSLEALKRAGFEVNVKDGNMENPVYIVRQGKAFKENHMFSKVYDHPLNPEKDFAAVMVCSRADTGCPFIPGAGQRFSITWDDPGKFDNTPLELEKYNEICAQIAREMFYVFILIYQEENCFKSN